MNLSNNIFKLLLFSCTINVWIVCLFTYSCKWTFFMFFRHHGGDSTLFVYVASPHHQITSKNMFFEVKILTHSWDFRSPQLMLLTLRVKLVLCIFSFISDLFLQLSMHPCVQGRGSKSGRPSQFYPHGKTQLYGSYNLINRDDKGR